VLDGQLFVALIDASKVARIKAVEQLAQDRAHARVAALFFEGGPEAGQAGENVLGVLFGAFDLLVEIDEGQQCLEGLCVDGFVYWVASTAASAGIRADHWPRATAPTHGRRSDGPGRRGSVHLGRGLDLTVRRRHSRAVVVGEAGLSSRRRAAEVRSRGHVWLHGRRFERRSGRHTSTLREAWALRGGLHGGRSSGG